uniref:Alpha N-terminal protein methyltransferase 1 n=1 Tax=Macrostomum lignano TaxID=282301 RepID=A0A1I8FA86_9PLAT
PSMTTDLANKPVQLNGTSKDAADKTSKDAAAVPENKANNCDEAQQQEAEFYTDAERYWATVEATEAGMMGGNDSLDEIEISSSRMFLTRAAELAGLSSSFNRLWIAAPASPGYQEAPAADVCHAETRYDLVWVQWVIGHLRDAHLWTFCAEPPPRSAPAAMIGVKDNVITRPGRLRRLPPRRSLLNLFNQAGLIVLLEETQEGSRMPCT